VAGEGATFDTCDLHVFYLKGLDPMGNRDRQRKEPKKPKQPKKPTPVSN
jgi:hypothetical protein